MGFGLTLGKQVATTGANALTGGLVNGIMGLFGGSNKAEKRQYQHEKEMMGLQHEYNMQAAAKGQEYAKEMNRINFEQQNQMFDKQAEWHSAEQQKQRLKEAGLNPGLMYGIGGEGGSSVSSGGGTGSEVQGVGNPGTQAVMMGLQAKSIESQIALNNAQASKINAETEKTEKETEKTGAETESYGNKIQIRKQVWTKRSKNQSQRKLIIRITCKTEQDRMDIR
jgi:hypothetical protein